MAERGQLQFRGRAHSAFCIKDWFASAVATASQPRRDPNTIYAELQGGTLARFDKTTGQRVGIQPQAGRNEDPLRWNWDSPFIISPHLHTRLYFAANKLYRSDDRGDTWKVVSGELSRDLDRDKLPVMGRSKHGCSSQRSIDCSLAAPQQSIIAKKDGLIYIGTDDGTSNHRRRRQNWRKVERLATYPNSLTWAHRCISVTGRTLSRRTRTIRMRILNLIFSKSTDRPHLDFDQR
jgi:hypothetical protein